MPKVVLEDQGAAAVLRLSNGVTNAVDAEMVDAFFTALEAVKRRYGGLVLAGNTKFFSIGLDVPNLRLLDREAMAAFWNRFEDLVLALYTLPMPTACAICGHATGGGAILALACDYRFMSEGKKMIALNEVKIGVPVPYLADLMLRQIVTDRVAVEIEFNSGFLGPGEARAAGLADAVDDEKTVEAKALEKVRALAAMPRTAFALTKRHRTREIPLRFKAVRDELNRTFLGCWFEPATQALLEEASRKF